jgi:hypothetical protein
LPARAGAAPVGIPWIDYSGLGGGEVAAGSRASGWRPQAELVISSGNETLRAPAFGTLIDVMHEARLVRFGFDAGKAHLGAAFHALRVLVETRGLALWHCPPMIGCWHALPPTAPTIEKLPQPTRICPSHVEGVHGAVINVIEPDEGDLE